MLLTQSDYGKRVGRTQQWVSVNVRNGKIPLVNGKIDPDVADAAMAISKSINSRKTEVSEPSQPQGVLTVVTPTKGSVAYEQAALVRARREKIEFGLCRERGELISVQETAVAWSEMIIAARGRLLMIPDGIIDLAVRAQVDRLIRDALADVANLPIVDAG